MGGVEVVRDPLVPATNRAVKYRRVSTDEQLEGYGLDVQDDAIEKLAADEGLEIIGDYVDEGVSGTVANRIGLVEAIDVLAAGEARWLLIARLDRLSRDLFVQESVLRDVWAHGEVLSAAAGERAYLVRDDPADPSRGFVRKLLGLLAEYDRQMIVARLRAGRRRKIAAGGRGGGPVPYGWRQGLDGLEEVEVEQDRLAAMARERADNDRTYTWIAAWANSQRWPARNGETWTHSSVRRAVLSWYRERERPTRQ